LDDPFFVEPSLKQLTSEFENKCSGETWWSDFVGSDNTLSTYGFTSKNDSAKKAWFSYSGSPYYATVQGSAATSYTEFDYRVGTKQSLNTGVFVDTDGVEIDNLNNTFYKTPNSDDVTDALCILNPNLIDDVYWTQLEFTIIPGTIGNIVIAPENGSNNLFYKDSKTITYTLISP
jgi:hypothetical protein